MNSAYLPTTTTLTHTHTHTHTAHTRTHTHTHTHTWTTYCRTTPSRTAFSLCNPPYQTTPYRITITGSPLTGPHLPDHPLPDNPLTGPHIPDHPLPEHIYRITPYRNTYTGSPGPYWTTPSPNHSLPDHPARTTSTRPPVIGHGSACLALLVSSPVQSVYQPPASESQPSMIARSSPCTALHGITEEMSNGNQFLKLKIQRRFSLVHND